MTRSALFPLFPFLMTLALDPAASAAAFLAAGQDLSIEATKALVQEALPVPAPGARWSVSLVSPAFPLANHARTDGQMVIQDLQLDDRTGRLVANLRVTLAGGETGTVELQGRAEEQVEVPVLEHGLNAGQQVQPEDLVLSWQSAARARGGLTDAELIVGREAGHRLPPGRILQVADLRTPTLVQKGETVSLLYVHGGLQLATSAVALESGVQDDLIRIVNPSSRRELRGRITGRREVRIDAMPGDVP